MDDDQKIEMFLLFLRNCRYEPDFKDATLRRIVSRCGPEEMEGLRKIIATHRRIEELLEEARSN